MRVSGLAMAFAVVAFMSGTAQAETARAVVAGGCFWCVEADFERVKGVTEVVSGFTGGPSQAPTYDNHEGHVEAVEIRYDPSVISYAQILHLFLRSVDVDRLRRTVLRSRGKLCDGDLRL